MEVLNKDLLHDQIFDGEDGEDADLGEDGSPDVLNTKKKVIVKKSGKPQNLDLLPSNYSSYILQDDQAANTPNGIFLNTPNHMIKEVVQVDDGFTLIQESIFNKEDYSEGSQAESDMSENSNKSDLNEFPQPEQEQEEEVIENEDQEEFQQFPVNGNDELIQPLLNQEEQFDMFHPTQQDSNQGSFDEALQQQDDIEEIDQTVIAQGHQPMEHEEDEDHHAQLIQTQEALSMMEEKFAILNDQLTKLSGTTMMLETELVKRNMEIGQKCNEIVHIKAHNQQLEEKCHEQEIVLRRNKTMAKDLNTYKKLIKDQNECIEQLHKSQAEDQLLVKSLQKENKKLKESMAMGLAGVRQSTARVAQPSRNSMGSSTASITQSFYASRKSES